MKRILLLLLTLAFLHAGAQVYNNEWIDYNKTYYKFKVGATGLYRITQVSLASIGLDNTNADHFKLWRNGKEIPLYTSVQNGPLGTNGYIEFWGEMNDGKADLPLYRQPDYQLNDKWSLQTDTAAYFLTVNLAGNNLRLIPTVNDVAGNTLPADPYFMYTTGVYYKNKINIGRQELVGSSYTYSSSYDMGEGYTSGDIANGATVTSNIANLRPYIGAGAPDPFVKIHAAGNATNARNFRLRLNGDSILGAAMDYYDYVKVSRTVPNTLLNSGSASFQVTNLCTTPSDRMVVAQIELTYPRLFNFTGTTNFYFELPANTAGNNLVITGFNYSGGAPILYDLTNGKRYEANTSTASQLKIVLQPSSVDRKLVLVSQAATNIKGVTSFEQRNFIDYKIAANQGNYLIITHPALTAASGGADPVEDYRAYRSSPQGGSYNAKVFIIDQLVDQFAFGIKRHPLSIRNFLRWARANYSSPLKSVLLIGKGVIYTQFRAQEKNPDIDKLDLVPTFGNPASDNLLSAAGSSSVPLTPIGRISVINKQELGDYLEKVKQYEQVQTFSSPGIADKAWMKNIVHVTGASDNNTSDILLESLNGHKKIIEDTSYAGNVTTFTKSSADAVQQVSSLRLENLFKEGIGILTYFGHSSASTLEFNLDKPQAYDNQGKYPVFIVMGCNAGSFYNYNVARFSTKETISERFVLAKERGAIAFLASTHLGIVHYLDIYNSRNYNAISNTKYGATLGEIMDEAIKEVFGLTTENDFYARFQCEQFALHGDPALRLYNFEKPDYVIEEPLVKISPSFISIDQLSFKVNAVFMNIGKAINKDIIIELKRTHPDQIEEVFRRDTIRFTKFSDSLSYTIPIDRLKDRGLNKITVTIDAGNAVDELYETNNTVTKDVYIIEDDIKPVYPYSYSIINDPNLKLVASTANPFARSRDYMMEIDTTELFNSPLKVSRSITSEGGVIEFTPGITFTDSTVYYWRVATAVISGSPNWNSSSFVYIPGNETGFNQSHYFQHAKSVNQRQKLVPETRQWKYETTHNSLFITHGCWVTAVTQEAGVAVSLNNNQISHNTCAFSSLVFNVVDSASLIPWVNTTINNTGNGGLGLAQYGSVRNNCFSGRTINFEWRYDTPERRKMMMDFMKDTIPDGKYVIVRNFTLDPTRFPTYPQAWAEDWKSDEALYGTGNSLYHYLKNAGLTSIDSFYRARPFALVYKKNDPSFAPRWIMGEGIYDNPSLTVDLPGIEKNATLTSPLLGPAKQWNEFRWEGFSLENPAKDIATASIIGVKPDGAVDTLINNISKTDQVVDVSAIDAKQYPYLKLSMNTTDTSVYTPYQLKYWRLYYEPVPEGAIAPNIYFKTKDTVTIGTPVEFGIAFKNVSKVNFDSVKVKFAITNEKNIEDTIWVPRQKILVAGDTIKLNVSIDTKSLSGNNTLFVNFNPEEDQPEQYLLNNYAFRNLFVIPDSLSPVMDVTFDGTHILNKDIISAKPRILIKLTDEMKSLLLNDTSLVTVNVRYPNGDTRRFYFTGNDTLQFIPADQNNNTASVNFTPYFPEDGEYELIVIGKDRSGNFAGQQYKVAFTIINKPMISNMLNYPNPFTTSTSFVFTLTGAEVPQNIRIQVLTITGKIVREITKEELGPLHIGRNITEFKWDGTDQYGQKLANGIYLYRVITNLNGKSLDKYKAKDDNTDKYFNKGYGKMYLMR
ncbi:C25 family cysteine peptidase [Terrimonas pollutisoli]|uniref:putative type IX secretion system sortase PorU2 n=1 Tax=Terrimonas pollutisoli TaxID=3034147 RepID=UPI0023EACDC2|nr:C25 family cysteine peptidase [Terrimonas sp. H1YJ31]